MEEFIFCTVLYIEVKKKKRDSFNSSKFLDKSVCILTPHQLRQSTEAELSSPCPQLPVHDSGKGPTGPTR
jgi:hypothetical protein